MTWKGDEVIPLIGDPYDGAEIEVAEIFGGKAPKDLAIGRNAPHLPDGSGSALLEEVLGWDAPSKVVIVSGLEEDSAEAVEAFRPGAFAFVGKPTAGDRMLAVIHRVLSGRRELPDGLLMRLIRRRGRDEPNSAPPARRLPHAVRQPPKVSLGPRFRGHPTTGGMSRRVLRTRLRTAQQVPVHSSATRGPHR